MRKNISWNLVSKYRTELMGCSILGIILFHWYENCMIHGKSINFILHLFSLGNRFVEVFLILSGMGLYYSFKKQENIKTFYLRRITKLLPTYLILGIPYWIYFDCFLNKMNWASIYRYFIHIFYNRRKPEILVYRFDFGPVFVFPNIL